MLCPLALGRIEQQDASAAALQPRFDHGMLDMTSDFLRMLIL